MVLHEDVQQVVVARLQVERLEHEQRLGLLGLLRNGAAMQHATLQVRAEVCAGRRAGGGDRGGVRTWSSSPSMSALVLYTGLKTSARINV